MHSESQWTHQEPLLADNSSWLAQDNCVDLDLGTNVPPEWFLSNGNYNFELGLASVDWSKINDNIDLDLGQNLITEYDSSNSLTPERACNSEDLNTWSCPNLPLISTSEPPYSCDQVTSSGIQSQNNSPSNRKALFHPHISQTNKLTLLAATLQWNGAMSATAHSDFFGLDLDLSNHLSPYTVSPEVLAQAQENLSHWIDLDDHYPPSAPEHSPRESLTGLTHDTHPTVKAQPVIKSPSIQSSSSYPDADIQSKCNVSSVRTTPQTPSLPAPSSLLTDPSTSKVVKSKQFHFVANSDKKTATRLRNTMTSRNLRQSKVSRIAQLERELEEQLQMTEKWKTRAKELGWAGNDDEADIQ